MLHRVTCKLAGARGGDVGKARGSPWGPGFDSQHYTHIDLQRASHSKRFLQMAFDVRIPSKPLDLPGFPQIWRSPLLDGSTGTSIFRRCRYYLVLGLTLI